MERRIQVTVSSFPTSTTTSNESFAAASICPTAAAASAYWPHMAIFLTWDCWGGWSDHVTPPLNRTWTGGGHPGPQGLALRFGNRVPLLVISPYAKQSVNHDMSSHASVVKFCIRLFGLQPWDVPALVAGGPVDDLWDCFDFTAPPAWPRHRTPPHKPMPAATQTEPCDGLGVDHRRSPATPHIACRPGIGGGCRLISLRSDS